MTKRWRPRNGEYLVGLLVGGDPSFNRDLKVALGESGVYLRHTWDAREADDLIRRPFPPDADVAIVVRNPKMSRRVREGVEYRAKRDDNIYAVDAAMSVKPVLQVLEGRGFVGERLDVEGIEGAAEVLAEGSGPIATLADVTDPEVIESIAASEEARDEGTKETRMVPGLKMMAAAKLVKEKRLAAGLTTVAVGKALGLSASMIGLIEKGDAKPRNNVCRALEAYLELPEGTLPRLSDKENHTIVMPRRTYTGKPIGKEVPEPEEKPPAKPEPEKPPLVTPGSVERAVALEKALEAVARPSNNNHQRLEGIPGVMVRVAKLREEMLREGIASITITSTAMQVQLREVTGG